jgi:hypothetical protein
MRTVFIHSGWLRGRNLRTNVEGYFPCETYVEYVPGLEKPKPLVRPRLHGKHAMAVSDSLYRIIDSI